MKTYVGDRLPSFTEDQSKMLKSSYDYIGINYYGAIYAANVDNVDPNQISYSTDVHAQWKSEFVKNLNFDLKSQGDQNKSLIEMIRMITNLIKEFCLYYDLQGTEMEL